MIIMYAGEQPPRTAGDYLRSIRQRADLTLGQVARATGWSVVKVSDMERDRAEASESEVARLARVYRQDPADMVMAWRVFYALPALERAVLERDMADVERYCIELESSGKDDPRSLAHLLTCSQWLRRAKAYVRDEQETGRRPWSRNGRRPG